MKTATVYTNYPCQRKAVAYPNAATGKQMLHKLLDGILMGACGAGIGAMILMVMVLL